MDPYRIFHACSSAKHRRKHLQAFSQFCGMGLHLSRRHHAYTPAVEPKIKSLGLRQLTALIGVGNYRVFDPPVRGRGTNHSFTVKYPRQITMMAFAPDM